MTARPLVSVITPTWQRPELLRACIENVRAQVYRPLVHVVVSDGRDDALVAALRRWGFVSAMRLAEAGCDAGTVDVPIQTAHLGRTYAEIERLNSLIREMESTRAWRMHQWLGRRRS